MCKSLRFCSCPLTLVSVMVAMALRVSAGLFDTWGFHADLTFSGYSGSETLSAFPVLVSVTNFPTFSYSQVASPSGADLRFSDATGSIELNYEIERWDTNAASYVWVQVPALATNTTIRAYWGRASVSAPAYTTDGSAWSNGYVAVYHLAASSGTLEDSSPQSNTLTKYNDVQLGTNGYVGAAARWPDGSNDWLQGANHSSLDGMGKLTLETWMYDEINDGQPRGLISKRTNSTSNKSYYFFKQTNRNLLFYIGGTGGEFTNTTTDASRWYHVAATYDMALPNNRMRAYVDGALKSILNIGSGNVPALAGDLHIGILNASYGNAWKGKLDEVRISAAARSPDWIKATYDTAKNETFATYGIVLATDDPKPGILSVAARNVSTFSADAVCNLSRLGSANPTVYLAYGTNTDALASTNNLGVFSSTGDIITPLADLGCVTTYYYRHIAVNEAGQSVSFNTISFTTKGAPVLGAPSASNLVRSAFFSADLLDSGVSDTTVSLWAGTSPTSLALLREWSPVSTPTLFSHELTGQTLGATLYYSFRAVNSYSGAVYSVWSVTNAFTLQGSTAWTSGGGADTDWSTADNWSFGVPGAGAQADFLSAAKGATVTAAATALDVKAVSVQTGGGLTFDLGADSTLRATSFAVGTNTASSFTLASGVLDVGSGGLATGLGSSILLGGGSLNTSTLTVSGTSTKIQVNSGAHLTSSGLATLSGSKASVQVPTGGVWSATGINMVAGPVLVKVDGGVVTNEGSLYLGNNGNGAHGDMLLVTNQGVFRQNGSTIQVAVKKDSYVIAADGGRFESAATVNLGTGSDWGGTGYLIASNGTLAIAGSVYVCADARYNTQRFMVYRDGGHAAAVTIGGGVYLGMGGAAGSNSGNYNNVFRVYGGDVQIGSSLTLGGTLAASTNNVMQIKGPETHVTAASLTVRKASQLVFTVDNSGFARTPIEISGGVSIDNTTRLVIDATARTQRGYIALIETTGGTFASAIPDDAITVNGSGACQYSVVQAGSLALKVTTRGTVLLVF